MAVNLLLSVLFLLRSDTQVLEKPAANLRGTARDLRSTIIVA